VVKNIHEIRDPVHVFIRLDTDERRVVDSVPFQRLRYIHQLAMSYLVYPGATHKRFEHSLGVMELAGKVFDVFTNNDNVYPEVRELIPEIGQRDKLIYWRRALRMAALCHDLGHLPFSHAAEKELLPEGWDHERLTVDFIRSPEMQEIWESVTPPLRVDDLVKLAVGPKKLPGTPFSDWEAILSEIIVGDAFGVDRMDYLLRDSHHAGVVYGRFDHFRLIDTLRILPRTGDSYEGSKEPVLGIEEGGLHSAEALLLARYFMYSQVYFHPVRRIYDIHLKDFLKSWLPEGRFPVVVEELKKYADNDVISAIWKAFTDSKAPGHDAARRIVRRQHYRKIYQKNPEDVRANPEAGRIVFGELKKVFGEDKLRYDCYTQKEGSTDFPVLCSDGRIISSFNLSRTLQDLPVASFEYIFIEPDLEQSALSWLQHNRQRVLENPEREE